MPHSTERVNETNGAAVVQWNHARFGVRGVSKRTGSNPVHDLSVGRVKCRRNSVFLGNNVVTGKVLHYHGLPPHPHAHTRTPTNLPYPPLTQDPPTPALTEAEETKGHKVKK
ncbi:hypothetical protein E2C01_031118 [Portunus trituberculatus]|uniref:Uncharacterized protein n=1 Tax=Portunus trituberculatus TaxID=210409 RepID=A0A5B7EX98_PORTR|nr:hypothetical protein [Portunus trituberculatus]